MDVEFGIALDWSRDDVKAADFWGWYIWRINVPTPYNHLVGSPGLQSTSGGVNAKAVWRNTVFA